METIKDLGHLAAYWKPSTQKGELGRLYDLLFVQGVNREVAVQVFREAGKSDSHFRNVLSDLVDKLIGGLITGNFSQFTPVQKKHFSTLKKYVGAEVLIQMGNKFDGIALANNTLQLATEHGQIDIALALARRLYHHYSGIEPNSKRRSFYREKVAHLRNALNKELDIEEVYNEINFRFQKGGKMDDLAVKLKSYQPGEYWRFNLHYYTSKVLMAFYRNDETAILNHCREAIESFEQTTSPLPYITRWVFEIYRIPLLIGRSKFEQAEISISRCLTFPSAGEYNWYLTLYFKALLGFYSNKPQISLQAYYQAIKTKPKAYSTRLEERWVLLKAYLCLYHKWGLIDFPDNFRLYKFLNSVETTYQDKVGANVAIIVVHLLHLLTDIQQARVAGNTRMVNVRKKAFMEKADTIPSYIQQHISRNPKHARSRLFLKMLARIDHGDYYKARVSKAVSKWYNQLRRTPKTINTDILEAELVPYEQLWTMVLSLLK